MTITFDKLAKYKKALDEISNESIRNEIFSILESLYKGTGSSEKKPRNTSLICQLDAETFEIINKYSTFREANEALGKVVNSSGISDATRGRNSTHYAYGFRWAREDELAEVLKMLKEKNETRAAENI